jgi:hypothetical protein
LTKESLNRYKELHFGRVVLLDNFQLCGGIFGNKAKFEPGMDETFQAADIDVILVIPVVQAL